MSMLVRLTDLGVLLSFAVAGVLSMLAGHDLLTCVSRAAVCSIIVALIGRLLANALRASWDQKTEQTPEQQSGGTAH